MSRIPQDVIDQVLAAHDIAEVIGRFVSLKHAGRAMKALCPFHDEKTPSFTVNPDRQSFKCFGCGKGGNVFGFLMEHQGLTFPEAVRALAGERGIRIPETPGRAAEDPGRVEGILKALAFAQGHFQRALASPEGAEARAYLAKRGYDPEAVRRFGLGYAPPGWDRLLKAAETAGILGRLLEEAGLVIRRDAGGPGGAAPGREFYDRFRHRITFPISDLRGKVVTFGARALDPADTPKYLNGPETPVFRKSSLLFALDRARDAMRRTGEALLMEGYTDVLMAHLHGVDRAVAGMGTAFTPDQAGLLRRFASRVVLVYDADDAGRAAAERAVDVLVERGLEVRIARLPEGRDVDEILLEEGKEALETVIGAAEDLFDFKLRLLGARHDLTTASGRARAAEALVATAVKVPSAVERDQLFRVIAERLGGREAGPETEAVLRKAAAQQLASGRGGRAGGALPGPGGRAGAFGGSRTRSGADSQAAADRHRLRDQEHSEACLVAGILAFPGLRGRVYGAVAPEDFTSPALRRLYEAALALEASGRPYDARALSAVTAEDGEAAEALASLPEDPTLEDRVLSQVDFLDRRRREKRRAQEFLQALSEGRVSGEPCQSTSPPFPIPHPTPHPTSDPAPSPSATPANRPSPLNPLPTEPPSPEPPPPDPPPPEASLSEPLTSAEPPSEA